MPLRSELLNAEEDLIVSLNGGVSTLEGFRDNWSRLVSSLQAHPIDDDTSLLARDAASRVSVLASSFLKVHEEIAAINVNLMTELDGVLSQLSLETPTPRSTSTLINSHTRLRVESPSSSPPHIAPAYKWLLKNICNPYPSKETKELMARGTGTSLQNIDAWFLNARRRIGWTGLSKRYFGGSKTDTISAAFSALKDDTKSTIGDEDQDGPTPLPANIRMAFVEMEDAAKRLYSEKYTKSELAGTLDRMVKDMTDGDKKRRKEERKAEKALQKLGAERDREEKRSRDAQRRWKEAEEGYPSPSPEPESLKRRFETPTSVVSEEEDLTPPMAGCKRASTEDSTDEREVANGRPLKRSRFLSSSSSYSSIDRLSSVSPQNSLELFPISPSSTACSTPLPSTPSEDTITSLPHQEASPKRKRRLSDADVELRPKRPMPLVRPRLQVVSDPLPKSVSLASLSTSSPSPAEEAPPVLDWSQLFDQHFIAVTDELDPSGPIKMDMFDYSQFADYASSGETSDGTDWEAQCRPFESKGLLDPISQPSSPAIHIPSLTFTDFEFPAPVTILPDLGLDFCATMGWPYGGGGGIPNKPASTGSALEDTELNRLDGLSSLASLPPYQSDIPSTSKPPRSDEGAFDPLSSIDWSSIIPQTIPPTRPVVSILPNPASVAPVTINPTAYVGSGAESRAEKLRKYQEHLAQARRLQEELAFV